MPDDRTRRIVGLGLFLAVAGGIAFLARDPIGYALAVRAFPEDHVGQLGTVAFPDGEGTVAPGSIPTRTGRVVIVNPPVFGREIGADRGDAVIQAAKLDRDWARLPGNVRATAPGEAGTLIICRRRVGPVGLYVPRGASQVEIGKIAAMGNPRDKGHQHLAYLEVFDLKLRIRVGSYTVAGEPPPPIRERREDGKPADVVAFVLSMPVR